MGRCLVPSCENYHGKKQSQTDVRFFGIPKDAAVYKKWLKVCGIKKLTSRRAYVCSAHFTEQDYKLEHILMNVDDSKKRLKPGAVPSKNLPVQTEPTESEKILIRKKLVEQALSSYERQSNKHTRPINPKTYLSIIRNSKCVEEDATEGTCDDDSISQYPNQNQIESKPQPTDADSNYSIDFEEISIDNADSNMDDINNRNESEEINSTTKYIHTELMENIFSKLCNVCGKENEDGLLCLQQKDDYNILQILEKFVYKSIDSEEESKWKVCYSCMEFLKTMLSFSLHIEKVQEMFIEIEFLIKLDTEFDLNELRSKYKIADSFKSMQFHIENDTAADSPSKSLESVADSKKDTSASNQYSNVKPKADTKTNTTINSIDFYNPDFENDMEIEYYVGDSDSNSNVEEFADPEMDFSNNFDVVDDHNESLNSDAFTDKYLTDEEANEDIECEFCFSKFRIHDDLVIHLEKEHKVVVKAKIRRKNRKKKQCEVCQETFTRTELLNRHLKNEHNIIKDIFACDMCDKKFRTSLKLKYHLRTHLPAEEKLKFYVPCPYCDQRYCKRSIMRDHVRRVHTNERNFVCELCGERFSTSTILYTHKQTQHSEIKVNCSICQKEYKNKSSLRFHMLTHRTESVSCSICGTVLKNKSILKNHMMLHSNVADFKCKFCGKEFQRKVAFQFHMIIHTGLKPFGCQFCGLGFANPGNCKKHEKRSHADLVHSVDPSSNAVLTRKIPSMEELESIMVEMKNNNQKNNDQISLEEITKVILSE